MFRKWGNSHSVRQVIVLETWRVRGMWAVNISQKWWSDYVSCSSLSSGGCTLSCWHVKALNSSMFLSQSILIGSRCFNHEILRAKMAVRIGLIAYTNRAHLICDNDRSGIWKDLGPIFRSGECGCHEISHITVPGTDFFTGQPRKRFIRMSISNWHRRGPEGLKNSLSIRVNLILFRLSRHEDHRCPNADHGRLGCT